MSEAPATRGRYHVVHEIGRGGMGIVYRVHDAARGEDVALKRILSLEPEGLLRFKREFRVMEELLHPSLVRLHELDADEHGVFFTMELIAGTTLRRYCRADAAPDDDRATLSRRAVTSPLAVTAPPLDPRSSTFESPGEARSIDEAHPAHEAYPTHHRARPTHPAFEPLEPPSSVPPPSAEGPVGRLTAVLPQLLEALAFLHGHGVVHRDLKPSNVMVTPTGKLKLLDFGVLAELGQRPGVDGNELCGTVGYIAPEVLQGDAVSPAADLYALGVVLFELASGRRLFDGTAFSLVRAHISRAPPRLSDVVLDAPSALVEVCAALLAKSPGARPSLERVADLLAARAGAGRSVLPPPRADREAPVGREPEQRALLDALARAAAGAFVWTSIVGASGSGKTTLAQWLAREAEERGATVLRGRGRSSERVPFNAIDGAVDDLAHALRDDPALGPGAFADDVACAASAFPVLAACCPDAAPISAGRARPLVFEACARVLAAVGARGPENDGARGPMVLFVDDLQWADDDSRALLLHLLDVAPQHVLVVTTLRDDVESPPAITRLLARPGVERLALGALETAALSRIVRRVAVEHGHALPPEVVERAVASCAGRPFLAEMTARALAHDPAATTGEQSLTAAMLAPALAERRSLLALLVAADGWMDVSALAELEASSVGATEDAVKELSRAGVVRRGETWDARGRVGQVGRAGGVSCVTVYHDVVRAAALGALGADALQRAHGAIADWMAGRADARLEPRVQHLISAGRGAEASGLARAAAEQAEGQRAYALAAEMYEIATRAPGADRLELLRRRARNLEQSASYAGAAACWAEIAAGSPVGSDALVDARLREAAALVACHDMKAGVARLREGLALAGLPPLLERSALRDAATGARFLLGPVPAALTRRHAPDARAIARCERDLRAALLVAYVDPLAGMRILQRVRRDAGRAGADELAAWCDWTFAYYALFLNGRAGPVPLADRYIASARRPLQGNPVSDRIGTLTHFVGGLQAERFGRWQEARDEYDVALGFAERMGFGTTEHALVLMNRAQVDLFSQRFAELRVRIGAMRATSRASPQTTLATYADVLEVFALVNQGRLGDARALLTAVLERLDGGGGSRLGYATRLLGYAVDIFEDGRGAHLRWRRDLERGRRFGALRYMRLGAVLAIGAQVEAGALRRAEAGASYERTVRLARESLRAPPLMVGTAYRALAYAEDARGHAARAMALLERAEREAVAHDQPVDRAVAAYQRGLRLRGEEGARLLAEAREHARASGVGERMLQEDAGKR